MIGNDREFYRKHFEDLAEQHKKQYEYYKNKAEEFANVSNSEEKEK